MGLLASVMNFKTPTFYEGGSSSTAIDPKWKDEQEEERKRRAEALKRAYSILKDPNADADDLAYAENLVVKTGLRPAYNTQKSSVLGTEGAVGMPGGGTAGLTESGQIVPQETQQMDALRTIDRLKTMYLMENAPQALANIQTKGVNVGGAPGTVNENLLFGPTSQRQEYVDPAMQEAELMKTRGEAMKLAAERQKLLRPEQPITKTVSPGSHLVSQTGESIFAAPFKPDTPETSYQPPVMDEKGNWGQYDSQGKFNVITPFAEIEAKAKNTLTKTDKELPDSVWNTIVKESLKDVQVEKPWIGARVWQWVAGKEKDDQFEAELQAIVDKRVQLYREQKGKAEAAGGKVIPTQRKSLESIFGTSK